MLGGADNPNGELPSYITGADRAYKTHAASAPGRPDQSQPGAGNYSAQQPGSSSYQMLPGLFRSVCCNGLVCGESFGEVRVPHKGNVVEKVIEGAYEVLSVFDQVEEKRDAMQSLMLPPPAQQALAKAALTYRFGEEHQPVTESQLLAPRRWQDESGDLWTTYQRIQENLIKGGLNGRTAKGGRTHTRAIQGIDGDIKLNRALWVMAENMLQLAS